MSTTIDQRVAELRFDNAHFEKNVATSMSTLDKLKQKLNLTGASKGLEDVGHAAKKVDMSPLAKGVEVVQTKLSALSSMKDQFFRNLENNIERTARNFARMFTVDPIKTGFNEYELKMGSIQTIMASTGETLETVNGYLNELNEYSDKTIYSFSDMTQNIGKFTNAGVELKDAVAAIQGISNEAALSGANANEASRAMYNFAQALSAGYVKLIDWKSIENANMATVGFKEELIATALEMGTLTETTDGYATAEGKVITATKNFNDSLQDQWMTSDVLITTLKRYSDETTEIGKKATQAATEVKTFSQMMDSLKESAQSGWAQTYEILFGDFNEGKKLWTSIYNVASKVIDKMSDARNKLFKGVFNSKWDQLVEKVNEAGISTEDFSNTVIEAAREAEIPIDELIDEFGSLADVIAKGKIPSEIFRKAIKKLVGAEEDLTESSETVNKTIAELDTVTKRVMDGEFGNAPVRYQKLTEAGYDWATVQNKVNEIMGSSVRHVSDLTEAQKTQLTQLTKLDDETLKNKGYTEEQIEALKELRKIAEDTGSSFDDLIDSMEKPSGRELLIDSFKNLGEAAKEVLTIIGDAWKNIFGTSTTEEKSQSIYNLIEKFHDLTESMTFSEEAATRFRNILEGVFSAVDLSWSLASMSLMGGLKIINEVLKLFGTDLTKVLEWVALKIKDLNQWVEDLAFFGANTKWADFGAVIHAILNGLRNCLKALFDLERFSGVAKRFKEVIADLFNFDADVNFLSIEAIVGKINDFFTKIENWIKGIDNAENVGVYIVEGLSKGLWSGISTVGEAILGVGKAVFDTICAFFGINSPATKFIQIGKFCMDGLLLGFKTGNAGKIVKVLQNVVKLIVNTVKSFLGIHSPSTKFMEIASDCIDGIVVGFQNGFTKTKAALKSFGEKVVNFVKKLDWGKLIAVGLSVGLIVTMKKLSDTLQTFIAPFKAVGDGIGSMFKSIGDGLEAKFKAQALDKKSGAILKIAIAIGILVAALVVMSKIPVGKLWATIGALTFLVGLIVALSIACEKLNSVGDFGLKSASLVAIGGTILALALTLKILSTIDWNSGMNALTYLGGIIIAMGVFIAAVGYLVKGDAADNIHRVGSLMTKMAWALLLMVGVVKLASMLDDNTVKRGIAVIGLVELLFIGIIAISKSVKGDAKKVGQMLLKMSFALLIMVGVIKLAAMLDKSDVSRGMGVISAVGLLFAGLIAVSKFAGENASKAGGMLLKISGALLLMMWVVKIAGSMTPSELAKGAAIIAAFGGIIAALVWVSQYAGKEASAAGNMLIKAAVAMLIMTAVLVILQNLPSEGLGRAMAIITGLAGILAGLIYVSQYAKDADKAKGTLITLTIAIGVLALALIALSFLDPKNVAVAGAALTGVIGVFALLVKMTEHLKTGEKTWKRNLATIGVLTLVVAALGGVIFALSTVKNPQAALTAAGALSMLLLTMAVSLEVISRSKAFTPGKLNNIMTAFFILAGVMAALATVLIIMNAFDTSNALTNAMALSGMLVVMTFVIQNLSLLDGRKTKGLTSAIGCMALLALVMGLLGGILVLMDTLGVQNAIPNVIALSSMLLVLTGVLAVLCLLGPMASSAYAGVGALALVGLVVAELAVILALMNHFDINPSIEVAKSLSTLLLAMSGSLVLLGVVGLMGPAAFVGIGALATLIAGIGGLIVGIGALVDKFPQLETFLDKGIPILVKIGSGIGQFFGALVGGFVGGLGVMLPILGMQLSQFMVNATPFIEGAKLVDGSVLKGVGILAASVLALTAADLINNLGLLFGVSLPMLGLELSMFMKNALPFITGAMLITPNMLDGVKMLAETILILTGAGLLEGITRLIGGGSSLESFGYQLKHLGTGLKNFVKEIGSITEEQLTSAKNAAEIIKILAKASAEIPNAGGLLGSLVGENDMAPWAAQLPIMAAGLVDFTNTLTDAELTEDDVEIANKAAKIVKTLAKAAEEIPNAGGKLANWIGDNNLSTWAAQLPFVGVGIVGFCSAFSEAELTDEKVELANKAAKIVKTLAKAAEEVPNAGGKLAAWFGDNDLSTWATQLPNVGKGIKGFCDELGTFDEGKLTTVTTATKAIEIIANMSGQYVHSSDKKDFSGFGDGMVKLAKKVKEFVDKMSEVGSENVEAAVSQIESLIALATSIASTSVESLSTFGSSLKDIATEAVDGFVKTFTDESLVEQVKTACTNLAKSASDGIDTKENKAAFKTAGKNLIDGLINGLKNKDKKQQVYNAAFALGQLAVQGEKDGQKSNSPSKATEQAGKWLGEGLVIGINKMGTKVYQSGHELGQKATATISSAISTITDRFNTDIDTQPTIRPVLDLSDVTAGAGAINGMFSNPSMGVSAHINSISAMMSNRQNGNTDVVSAIDKLRRDLGNIGGNTYNVNGVTYDDGSNVSSAVESLVRAARIERRI